jgi:aldehyde:ferredoxin oxidoreductase
MSKGGYAGKIAIIDLSSGKIDIEDSTDYQKFGGGHGMATALFFDNCEDFSVDPLEPGNPLCIAASPFSGTIVPAASARVCVAAISPYSYPKAWFHHSSLGGRFAGELKQAGYDALVVTGKADHPVWINIIDDSITIEDADDLWGLDSWATQKDIWSIVRDGTAAGDWMNPQKKRDSGSTTQNPAVVCIGPAGENLCAVAALMHDAGHAAGQGGMGAVAGSKNLKAISALGTGTIEVSDPATLIDLRLELQEKFGYNVDNPENEDPMPSFAMYNFLTHAPASSGVGWNPQDYLARAEGCHGCFRNCRAIFSDTVGNQAVCYTTIFYDGSESQDFLKSADILNKYGINGFEKGLVDYPYALYKKGILGPGLAIDSNIDFTKYGTMEFFEELIEAIVQRKDIGAQLADGVAKACAAWGRWDEDSAISADDGGIERPQYGYVAHYEPRASSDWGFASVFTERDVDDHSFNQLCHWAPMIREMIGLELMLTAQETVETMATSTGLDDPMCWNYSADGLYSDANMRGIDWILRYNRFWENSMGFCGFTWPMLANLNSLTDHSGASPYFEPAFYQAVTGEALTWEESLERGHMIYLMERSIWALQGRERSDEQFTDYVYDVPSEGFMLPIYQDGAWKWDTCVGRTLDRDKFDDYKTRFYKLEGCNETSGYPTKDELATYDLDKFASALSAVGKLGD